jgi:hypothetical protein
MDQFDAAWQGNLQCMINFIQTGRSINDVDSEGMSALIWTVSNRHVQCAQWLLENGASVTIVSKQGWTALHFASYQCDVVIMKMLLDAGAVVDANVASDPGTPLSVAIRSRSVSCIKLLIDHGADIGKVTLNDTLPLPHWIHELVLCRLRCRHAAIIVMGIHKFRKTSIPHENDNNVLRLVAKHVWSLRMDESRIETSCSCSKEPRVLQ